MIIESLIQAKYALSRYIYIYYYKVYDHNGWVSNVNKREKGRVEFYRLTLECNVAKKNKAEQN